MKTKIQIKSVLGKLLFEYECENNSIKKTVEKAVKEKADLRSANLRSADLWSANLRSADLRSANLRSADLRSADLRSADLRSANLRSADLRSADLSSANLRLADLWSANLRSADLRSAENVETAFVPLYCKWSVTIHGNKISIGCEERTIKEWDRWFKSKEKFETPRDTEPFHRIEAHYRAMKAYVQHMAKFKAKDGHP